MVASQQSSESATAVLKEWMGETKKKTKKETKTSKKEDRDQKDTEPTKKNDKVEEDIKIAKAIIKRKLVSDPPVDFSPVPAVVDAQVNLIKAQLISEVEDAVEKVRVEEQVKAAKVRKTDNSNVLKEDLQLSDDEEETQQNGTHNNKTELQVCEVKPHTPTTPIISIYVCMHS